MLHIVRNFGVSQPSLFPRDIRPVAALLINKPGMARVRKHLSLFILPIHSRGASRRLKLRRSYRVTHHVLLKVVLASKLMVCFCIGSV